VHTGQNYDPQLSDVFFRELGIRAPDLHLGIRAPDFAHQVGELLAAVGKVLAMSRPDRVLILGDTNSGLTAIVAARMGIPVFHMEAGNRCFDDRVPEEINRRVIDHCSTVLLAYTHRSKENLLREGIERDRIFVTGNPIYEVLMTYASQIDSSDALKQFAVTERNYLLVTLHRSENVDDPARLRMLLKSVSEVGRAHGLPTLVSIHPRTADKIRSSKIETADLRLLSPLGFFDFVKLEQQARLVLSDSGTVQEECAIFHVPNVTIRDVTERPETLECGSNVLGGARPEDVLRAAKLAMTLPTTWIPPIEYTAPDVSSTVLKLVLGYTSVRRHSERSV
jgi:UDP-N-acetylglucosamine 2-epimerase (non-hydrolysing)